MFYERLSELCNLHGVSVAEVSKNVLNVSSGTPTGWKNGNSPKVSVLIAAAKYFGVSTDYLLGISDSPSNQSSDLTLEEYRIIHALRDADSRDRNSAILSMNAILGVDDAKTRS